MANATFFDSFITSAANVIFRGGTAPNSSNFYAILTLTPTSSPLKRWFGINTVIFYELAAVNGYARKSLSFGAGIYDDTNARHEFPDLTFTHTAIGGNIVYRNVVILANANATVANTAGQLVAFYSAPSEQTIVAGQNKAFTIPVGVLNSGYVAGI